MNPFKHFKTITNHKCLVMKYCFEVGLYKQGLLHDLSKYTWTEFSVGAKYYQGTRSPNNQERQEKGYSAAWLHHKGRNKHHNEYWTDYGLDGSKTLIPVKMPINYVVEMFLDRIAASQNYNKGTYQDDFPLQYYENGKDGKLLHEDTKKLLETLLHMLAEKGQKATFQYIKKEVLTGKVSY
ncbi:MAG: DUF5662 family protein [Lachnospiraceae bacterium]|nr:DUF5662 family protein [Lachnospiraceae bacterium]